MTTFSTFVLKRDNEILEEFNRLLDKNYKIYNLSNGAYFENTIPLKQQFLFPNFYGGVFRDVYVKILPKISISKISLTTSLNNSNSNAGI